MPLLRTHLLPQVVLTLSNKHTHTTMRLILAFFLLLYVSSSSFAQGTRLLRHPTVSRDSVAFEYAGDLWIVSRSGGTGRGFTSTAALEIDPHFSPDGSQIAFTATVAGNTD